MWHRLALALGGTVAELQERMPYREYLDWVALWTIEPWGDARVDMGAALVAALVANANRDRKKRPKPFTIGDFMPTFWRAKVERASVLAEKMKALFGSLKDSDG